MKRLISVFSAIVILICSLSSFAFSANAESFKEKMKAEGFPDTYIPYLVELHDKYPKWQFKAFKTGLDFDDAVEGERKPHSNQLVQKCSSFTTDYYCDCESCCKNGEYVIREGSSWISASESAVRYYMDPRNWLTEQYIFQFESIFYDESQTQSGVEAILSSSFMHNSYMTYLTTGGKTKTYTTSSGKKYKYSETILKAAKNSGLSAYFLASKIKQEIGAAEMTAIGVCGNRLPFTGLYNFYDIGATANGTQGLEWASGFLKTTKDTVLYSDYDSSKKKGTGTKTDVKNGHYMAYMGDYGDYYKVRLYTTNGYTYTSGKVGYMLKSDIRTTYLTYGRPWTNPYRSIYYGAQYVAASFSKYQNTSYLQKFNVNSESGMLHHHEYMKALFGAANEASLNYKAYKNAGNLSAARTFYIPVYKNMPSSACKVVSKKDVSTTVTDDASKVNGLKLSKRGATTLSVKWKNIENADDYYIHIKDNTNGDVIEKSTSATSYKITGLKSCHSYTVKVKAHIASKGWASYSSAVTAKTLPSKVKNLTVSKTSSEYVKLKWDKASYSSGYNVYKVSNGKYKKIATISSSSETSYKVEGLTAGCKYKYAVCAYIKEDGTKYCGSKSEVLTTVTKHKKVTGLKLTCPQKHKIKASWDIKSSKTSGYQIQFAHDKEFKDIVATREVTGRKTKSYTGQNLDSGRKYYIRVRAYRTINGVNHYGYWSDSVGKKCK